MRRVEKGCTTSEYILNIMLGFDGEERECVAGVVKISSLLDRGRSESPICVTSEEKGAFHGKGSFNFEVLYTFEDKETEEEITLG